MSERTSNPADEVRDAVTLTRRGAQLRRERRYDEAMQCHREAIAVDPRYAEAHNNLANCLRDVGRRQEAAAEYQQAIALKPDFVEAIHNLGHVEIELGEKDRGLASFRRAVTLQPGFADAHNSIGVELCKRKAYAEAETALRESIRLNPKAARPHNNLGIALKEQKRLAEAEQSLRAALKLKPEYPEALTNLGQVLRLAGKSDEAIACCRKALALDPKSATVNYNLGVVLKQTVHLAEAEACFRKAVALKPDYHVARFDLALVLLLRGAFAEGWREYEARWLLEDEPGNRRPTRPCLDLPEWKGEPLAGKTILLHSEQGLGDTIQFSRYVPVIAGMGARVILMVPRNLKRLLAGLGEFATTVVSNAGLPPIDFRCSLMSLPRLLGTDLAAAPPPLPTPIVVEAARIERWRSRIGEAGFKIGLCWQGNPTSRIDEGRSIPLRAFAPLARVPGARLIALQKHHGLEQIDDLPAGMMVETLGDDFDSGPDAFLDAAAVIHSLDLVVTSDTAIAHLAGSIAAPVCLVLGALPDWRWQLVRTDSPWYPSVTLFRQRERGDWSDAVGRLTVHLLERTVAHPPAGSPPRVPVSWGELIDKMTILEIKSARLTGDTARAHVRTELAALEPIAAAALRRGPDLAGLKQALREINETLWQIEDDIRLKEAAQEFDDGFVALARAVYRTNDERGRLKRAIDTLLGSTLVEEKQYARY
ncbi:MAG TPA: DUF6165 family protein [Candidatus Cybelea sp.]|nr:DUF6165 family protein [Candidatus Cybelea sp.]